jgi:hypothetical protein
MFNELYRILQKINAAADNFFDHYPTKRELYRTSRNISNTTDIEEENSIF